MFELTPKPDYKKIEREVLDFWEKKAVFKKSVQQRSAKKKFIFYEGPPTANGKPGIHHVLARSYKDIICRYQAMRGFRVERQAGWDTHGLPVELEVEKQLGIHSKAEIEKISPQGVFASIKKFNQLCRKNVFIYRQEWERLTRRIGFWLDLAHPYITYENQYIEKLWGVIKRIWQKKLLYQGYKVSPYCYRCGTVLSSHEVAQGYRQVTDQAVYVKFALRDNPSVALLAWTTTPWTLPGNVALAVGAEIDYLQIRYQGETLILARQRAEKIFPAGSYQIVKEFKGREMVGWRYQPLYDVIPVQTKDKYTVLAADFVTTEEGSGIVHTAVMYGEDDFELSKQADLPLFHTVDQAGRFVEEVKPFARQNVHQATPKIIADLIRKKRLFKQEDYTHSYPFCWRCRAPLIYYAKQAWFIQMSRLRRELVENNRTIQWVPAYIKKGRFGKWLEEVKDWAFSRERYWATPLPIWRCKRCGKRVCIGSIQELREKASQPLPEGDKLDLHRPFIDEIKLSCPKCQGEMERDKNVIDVWFDSGAMPFASGADKKIGYPADFIAEAIDQTRGWFYTLLAVSTLLGRGASYKHVISLGHILDEKGRKMSKSLGNIVEPNQILDKYGADNLRFYFFTLNQAGMSKRFSEKDLLISSRKNLMLLWNMIVFFKTYSQIDNWNPSKRQRSDKFLDGWLGERTDQLIKQVEHELNAYQVTNAARALEDYLQELSTWYLRLSRKRRTAEFYTSFYTALEICLRLLAPFMPFATDYLYQALSSQPGKTSIHWLDFPSLQGWGEERLRLAAKMQEVIKLANAERQKHHLRLRQPLSLLEVEGISLTDELKEIIQQEVNVLKVRLKPGRSLAVHLDKKITPALARLGQLRDFKRQIQSLRKAAHCDWNERVKLAVDLPKDRQWLQDYQKEIENDLLVRWISTIAQPDEEKDWQGIHFKLKK